MTDDRIRELLRLCESATPGPWSSNSDDDVIVSDDGRAIGRIYGSEDAEFVAAMRIAMPVLLTEVRWLRAAVRASALAERRLRAALEWYVLEDNGERAMAALAGDGAEEGR